MGTENKLRNVTAITALFFKPATMEPDGEVCHE
jgi:hypothetical protein